MKYLPLFAATFAFSVGAFGAQSVSDSKFARGAAGGGMAEVKLGQLAADKGTSDFVKQFGAKMVSDHSQANAELKGIAQKESVSLPSAVPAKEEALYKRLSALSGSNFDSAYIAAMKEDHTKDVREFQQEASNGKDSAIKDFATRTLPTVKMHLEMLKTQKMM